MANSRNRPWFPFYPADFLTSTSRFTDEQVGCYLRLLADQWLNEEIPSDKDELALISPAAHKHWKKLAPKFPKNKNPRLEEIREDMISRSEHGKKAAKARWDRDEEHEASMNQASNGDMPDASTPVSNGHMPQDATHTHTHTHTQTHTNTHTQTQKEQEHTRSKKPKLVKPVILITPQMWEAFKSTYPERQGSQGWGEAYNRAQKLVNSGIEWSDIMAGARRYLTHIRHAGKLGSETVLQARTFLNQTKKLWQEKYPLPTMSERAQKGQAQVDKFVADLEKKEG